MSTLFGSSRLRARALNCSSVNWGKGRAEEEAMNKTRKEEEEETILTREILFREQLWTTRSRLYIKTKVYCYAEWVWGRMNPNGLLVPTVPAGSRALASVRWNQQLERWQRSSPCYAAAAADEAQT